MRIHRWASLTLTALTLLLFSAVAFGAVRRIALVNYGTRVQDDVGRRVARALTYQVDHDLRRWYRVPQVQVQWFENYGPAGWPQVFLQRGQNPDDGFHMMTRTGPEAVVFPEAAGWWSLTASHELIEMLTDPTARRREICDPVQNVGYRIHGIVVSDFVLPSWYRHAGRWPYDEERILY